MKLSARYFLTILVIGMGVALWATSPGASSEHYVLINNLNTSSANTGTVLALAGTPTNPLLRQLGTLRTNVAMLSGGPSPPNVIVASHGSEVCLFLSDPQDSGNEISAFQFPGTTLTGNYNDPSITNSGIGIPLAARGNFLFAGYGNNESFIGDLAVWQIGTGCTLQLLFTYPTLYPVVNLAASPDGNTLVLAYYTETGLLDGADSFSIAVDGELTEHGPYGIYSANYIGDIDITADSKYALFSITGFYPSNLTSVGVVGINSDGSLGQQYVYGGPGGLGPGIGTASIRLSPNGEFIFVNDNVGIHISTLNFSENKPFVTWSGCYTTVRFPVGTKDPIASGIKTAFPAGSGTDLYVAEYFKSASIGTLEIDPTTGCTTEVPASPFALGGNTFFDSLATWPARPF